LDAVVTFADRLAQISGTATEYAENAEHADHAEHADRAATEHAEYMVILFPQDRRLWVPRSRRLQGVRAGTDGAYAFRNLPAGNYFVALAADAEPGEWYDPAFLQRLVRGATRATIADGESAVRNLSVK